MIYSSPSEFARKRPPASGMALVIVLTVLSLLLGLVITFLARTRMDRGASNSFAASSATQRLTDLATSLVKGQIRDATTQGNAVAWTSQPGMIRTFGTGSPGAFASGSSLLRVFKLYSARELISASCSVIADTPPSAWQTSGALWTDLNAPVLIENPDGGTPAKIPRFPILDPSALNHVEGFDVAAASSPDGSVLSGSSETLRLPMPVRWLYVLQDGRMITPPEDSGTTATITGATPSNPIVGRVAFWTDDETCKININTASEGTYWDTPRADTPEDRGLANYQPAQNEFQRYPGHPAMTSLAPVFFATSSTSTPALTSAQRDALYSIAPRFVGGGSDAGTQLPGSALQPDSDRLYTSVDELIFAASTVPDSPRSSQPAAAGLTRAKLEAAKFFLTASSQAPETTLFNTPRVAMWPLFQDLSATRITAFDRLIAFCSTINGQPYYFQRSDSRSSTADWVNIQRNRQILRYLRALSDKAVPGFGASLVSKTSVQDRDQLLVEMMDYIRSANLYDDNLSPGAYSSYNAAQSAVQFTTGRQSANTTDVWQGHGTVSPLRVPSGLADSAVYPAEPDNTSLMGFGRFHTISDAALLLICSGDGSAGTPGAPVNSTPADPAAAMKRASNDAASNTALSGTSLLSNERCIQAMLFFDFFSVMQGWTQYAMEGSCDIELQGGDFTLNGTPLGFPSSGSVNLDLSKVGQTLWGQHPWGGSIGIRKPIQNHYAPGDPATSGWQPYPFVSGYIRVNVPTGTNPTMHFQGPSKILLKIYNRSTTATVARELIQTIELKFPAADFPIPELKTSGTITTSATATPITPENWWSFNTRGAIANKPGRLNRITKDTVPYEEGCLIWPEDTLRTLVVYHGDTRLVAGSHYVPEGVFQPFAGYYNTSRDAVTYPLPAPSYDSPYPQIKNQLLGSAASHYEAQKGFYRPGSNDRLVAGASYGQDRLPRFPVFSLSGGVDQSARPFQQFGDFDNGIATTMDGAYVNKPDEGNNYRGGSGIPYFANAWLQAASGPTFFSPNRQIPGPGMFGSLPTRLFSGNQAFVSATANTGNTWHTLLLRPQTGHPGASDPADHLWLDFFWMPVVEPYAISSPFSTAGKINMNYAIEPFSYIRRATGLAALFRSEKLIAIPTNSANNYKSGASVSSFRPAIDPVETLKQFNTRFANGSVFLSPSQICDVHLVPSGQTLNSDGSNADSVMTAFWQTNSITGDNARERPYTNLQGRLTTKSNTFTVHYRVQTLKKPRSGDPSIWDETKDVVTAELRGSETIERYVNPNETAVPDYASLYSSDPTGNPGDLGNFYKWRTVNTHKFAP